MGGGFHGGFGFTVGAKSEVPITKLKDVQYNRQKFENYLLNENHPVGGSKAKFFREMLGYTVKDAKLFFKNVVSAIKGTVPTSSTTTAYGTKYTYQTVLPAKDGGTVKANVVVVVQKDMGEILYKIVTIYPYKKG